LIEGAEQLIGLRLVTQDELIGPAALAVAVAAAIPPAASDPKER
jgi:hypothetical protein